MEFLRSLESELLKIKGSRIPLITVLGGLLLSILFTLRYLYIGHHINLSTNEDVWEKLFSQNTRAFLGFIIPIGAILICTLITQIEYRNNNWKQIHTTPQRFSSIFLAKFSILFALIILVFIALNFGILMHGILPVVLIAGEFPNSPIPFETFFFGTLKCFALTLPIIAFQYLLSLYFKNFLIPLGIGLTVYVGSMPGIKLGSIGYLSPYSYVLNYFDQVITTRHIHMALVYFAILSLLNYFLYINKGEKG